jgi:large subunit ribosomal protein L18
MATNTQLFERRRRRVRHSLRQKSNGRIRLSVFRSGKHIYAQLIDDTQGKTLACASTVDKELKAKLKTTSTVDAAKAVGELLAKRGKAAKISDVVFDRGGFIYHGRVKALAEAAREGGLNF